MRWLIDGMNVIGTRPDGWWRDRHGAMRKLVARIEQWALASRAQVTVVFERPPRPPIPSTVIEITHAPRPGRDSADAEIVRLLAGDREPTSICVVTSDRRLAEAVRASGASVEASRPFRALIDDAR
jgi:predicted RNA-binding protein with PIN domain